MGLIVDKDIEFSHGVLNYLNAGFQGAFAHANVLSQFGLPIEFLQSPEEIRQSVVLVNKWLDDLWAGSPLFSLDWKQLQGQEPAQAYGFLTLLMSENATLSEDLSDFLSKGAFHELQPDQIRRCIGIFTRYAYARDNYIRGLHELAKTAKRVESQNLYRQSLVDSEKLVAAAHAFLTDYQSRTNQTPEFYSTLYSQLIALPGLLRAQAHDLNQMVTIYDGEFTFEKAYIPEHEGAKWLSLGLGPTEAGYWLAFDISAEEAVRWAQGGIASHQEAGFWRAWGFPPEQASAWFQLEFEPQEAALWANARISPEDADHYRNHGVSHPSLIKR